jgi:hypothetical protein
MRGLTLVYRGLPSDAGSVLRQRSSGDRSRQVNSDSLLAYRRLVTIAGPNQKLYGYLRNNGVDLNHVINLLEGAIALYEWSIDGGPREDCIAIPVMDEDGFTPVDV